MDQKKIIAYTIGVIMLMELIDGSALNTALPQIAISLQVNAITLKVAITVYLLTLGLFIPASAWFADKFGNKNLLFISISGFVISSMACGLSTSITSLIIFRAFQGVFGAFTMPVARLTMVRIFKGNMLAAMSVVAVIATIGPMIGPLVGGVITTYIGWRMIFFINLPIGIVAIILVYFYLPRTKLEKVQAKFDLKGFLIIGSSIAFLMLFVDLMIDQDISLLWKGLSFALSLILGFIYLGHAKKLKDDAVINLSVFKNECFRYFIVISTLSRLVIMGMMFIFPLYLQTKQGFSAFYSGLSLMAFIIPVWLVKKIVKPILAKLHFYKFFIINIGLMALIYIAIAYVFLYFNFIEFLVLLTLLGCCFGTFTIIINAAIYNSLDNNDHMGVATIINSTIIQLTSAFAISWVGIVLATLSGVTNLNFHSIISFSSYAWTQIIYSVGLFIIMLYIFIFKPKNLDSVPTT
ncbi:MFS transporter [Pseudofrancisella aestuarii]|uniref:MFS transporter n=1 Tax=Pseudofrancisella aestuarii TaxID=2670347 RepID=A0ABV9TB16_9GAMM|nr:MFS transporter [Pseudofrancisella aestuarii]